jgi:RNA recognition motif-containing protein
MEKNKLFVGNLPWSATTDSLREMFSQYGEVTDAFIPTDRETGRSRGFGFVTFANEADAQKALEMDGKEVDGRAIKVNLAKAKEERR